MKQKFIEWFTNNNNGCSPAMEDDRSFVHEKTQHMFEAYQAGVAEGEARCAALASENAYLLPKAASELSNAWVLHKYLIGIQAAIMYLDNGNKKSAQEWLYGTIAGPGFEFPDAVDDIDAWATHQMRGSVSHQQALEIIKAETPATSAFLAEVRAQGVEMLRDSIAEIEVGIEDTIDLHHYCSDFAAEIRKGVQS
ncbi:hypothetical protein ACLB5K_002407 [Enterobacter hormaechei]|uniref:hypothetical protein n=1 Tax=Enterobacter hormaechei TaxID=158836 RepID=UPI000689F033|nr:hypothetical protein [Enterobacter hormaechei]EGQ5309399.1 hypothetical protein [Enterobacter hormaechei]EGQ5314133.1 hypothetical protein [Enterobacter hormaechei]EGQ5323888.1 hypothetical protein [Enterobacter hormaechei]EKV8270452.1 hypothetical protein [Enterobacter hormaechei]EKV9063611.1 hypothetical protein [Enterobacter hormaechei]